MNIENASTDAPASNATEAPTNAGQIEFPNATAVGAIVDDTAQKITGKRRKHLSLEEREERAKYE